MLLVMLPLCYSDFKAKAVGQVTASDASESGGGLTKSVGLAGPGKLSLSWKPRIMKGIPLVDGRCQEIVAIEWFAGIGGLSRSLERLGITASGTVVCDNNERCLRVLREYIPGCEQWKDISEVNRDMIEQFLGSIS